MPLPNENKVYTYDDYLSWPEDERIENINGVPHIKAALLVFIKKYFLNYIGKSRTFWWKRNVKYIRLHFMLFWIWKKAC